MRRHPLLLTVLLVASVGCASNDAPSGDSTARRVVELAAEDTGDMVGRYTDPNEIAYFWAPSLHDSMASTLEEFDVESATAKAFSADGGSVRVLQLDFTEESGASRFVDDPSVSSGPDTPVCVTPQGRPAGCGSYSDAGSASAYWRAVIVDKRAEQVTLIVSQDQSKGAALQHIDDVASSLGLPAD